MCLGNVNLDNINQVFVKLFSFYFPTAQYDPHSWGGEIASIDIVAY